MIFNAWYILNCTPDPTSHVSHHMFASPDAPAVQEATCPPAQRPRGGAAAAAAPRVSRRPPPRRSDRRQCCGP